MSKTILSHFTPKQLERDILDPESNLKISDATEKVLNLQITIMSPKYDDKGNPIYEDEEEYDEDDDNLNPHHEYFNSHLLDEDYLDSQPYRGEEADEQVKPQKKTEQDLQDDIKKHLNIDFDLEGDNGQIHDENESMNSDSKFPSNDYRDSMRDSMPEQRLPTNSLHNLEMFQNQYNG